MADTPRPPADDNNSEFKDWLRRHQPDDQRPDDADAVEVPPSVAFMAMMRQAAERAQRSQRSQELHRALHPESTDPLPPVDVPYTPPAPPTVAEADERDLLEARPRRRPRRPRVDIEIPEALDDPPAPPVDSPAPPLDAPVYVQPMPADARQLIDELEAEQAPPVDPPERSASAEPAAERAAAPVRRKRSEGRRRAARRTVGVIGGLVRSLIIAAAAAGLTATIFTWWTPIGFLPGSVRQDLSAAIATSEAAAAVFSLPTPVVTPNYARLVGVVSGHRGPQNDPGAVCPDGLTEASINFAVAQRVVDNLRARGYSVDLLDEFDPRLDNYQAAALVSIHANTCQSFGEPVSGYLIAGPAARVTARGNDQLLVDCIARHYAAASGLQRREGVTLDMTHYHNFREIHPLTPGAIIELGFMLADRQVLTERQDDLARGITDGILCFIDPAVMATQVPLIVPLTTPTPAQQGT
ncbi:MAG: N-acetylmuramoyl-L-alanine amidase [Candidatus Flexifilum sp.]